MTDSPEDLVLVCLRRLDEKVDLVIDRIEARPGRIERRLELIPTT